MKLLFTFLGILLLYMSCIPCSDSNECNVKGVTIVSAATDHQQHNHDNEACSPFCTCTCCAVSTVSVSFIKSTTGSISFSSEKHLLFNVAFNAEGHYSIWEPPQLKV